MKRLALLALLIATVSGCASVAPNYNPSVENIQKLRDSGATKIRVGTFDAKLVNGQADDRIQLRASSMESPYGKFTSYIQQALKSELGAAKLLDESATVEVAGVVMKNDVSIAGFSEGYGEIEANVIVRRDGKVRYEKTKYTKITFESSFAGAVAIPAGQRAYPELVQKFLAGLYADPEFIAALK